MVSNLQALAHLSVSSTKIEGCLSFGHEVDPGMALRGVGNDVCLNGGGTKLALLRAAPRAGISQHELNVVRHRVPAELSIPIGGDKQRFGRIEEVAHEIGKDVDDRFSHGEVSVRITHQCRRRPCRFEHKFPPAKVSSDEGVYF